MAQLFGRIGYSFDLGAITIEPFVAGDATWIAIDPVRESGGATAVSVAGQDYAVASASTGIAASAALGKLRIESQAAARFELGDRAPQALIALAAAPAQATRTNAARLAGTAFTSRFGAALPLTRRIEIRLDYAGEFSKTDTEHTAQAGISIAF
jgi:outer membrane autotransporter protein